MKLNLLLKLSTLAFSIAQTICDHILPTFTTPVFYVKDSLALSLDEYFPQVITPYYSAESHNATTTILPVLFNPTIQQIPMQICDYALKKSPGSFFVHCSDTIGVQSSIFWYNFNAYSNTPLRLVSTIALPDNHTLIDYIYSSAQNQIYVLLYAPQSSQLHLYIFNPLNPIGPFTNITADPVLSQSKTPTFLSIRVQVSRNSTTPTLIMLSTPSALTSGQLVTQIFNYTSGGGYVAKSMGAYYTGVNISGTTTGQGASYLGLMFNDIGLYLVQSYNAMINLQSCSVSISQGKATFACKTSGLIPLIQDGGDGYFLDWSDYDTEYLQTNVTYANRLAMGRGHFYLNGSISTDEVINITGVGPNPNRHYLSCVYSTNSLSYNLIWKDSSGLTLLQFFEKLQSYKQSVLTQVGPSIGAAIVLASNSYFNKDYGFVFTPTSSASYVTFSPLLQGTFVNITFAPSSTAQVTLRERTTSQVIVLNFSVITNLTDIQIDFKLALTPEVDAFALNTEQVYFAPFSGNTHGNYLQFGASNGNTTQKIPLTYQGQLLIPDSKTSTTITTASKIRSLDPPYILITYSNQSPPVVMACEPSLAYVLACQLPTVLATTQSAVISAAILRTPVNTSQDIVVLSSDGQSQTILTNGNKSMTFNVAISALSAPHKSENAITWVGIGFLPGSPTLQYVALFVVDISQGNVNFENSSYTLTLPFLNQLKVEKIEWESLSTFSVVGWYMSQQQIQFKYMKFQILGNKTGKIVSMASSYDLTASDVPSGSLYCTMGFTLWITNPSLNTLIAIDLDNAGSAARRIFPLTDFLVSFKDFVDIDCNTYSESIAILGQNGQLFSFNVRRYSSPLDRFNFYWTVPAPMSSVAIISNFIAPSTNPQVTVPLVSPMLHHSLFTIPPTSKTYLQETNQLSQSSFTSIYHIPKSPLISLSSSIFTDTSSPITVAVQISQNSTSASLMTQNLTANPVEYNKDVSWVVDNPHDTQSMQSASFVSLDDLLTVDGHIGRLSILPAKLVSIKNYIEIINGPWSIPSMLQLGPSVIAKISGNWLVIYSKGILSILEFNESTNTTSISFIKIISLTEFDLFMEGDIVSVIYIQPDIDAGVKIGFIRFSIPWSVQEIFLQTNVPLLNCSNLHTSFQGLTNGLSTLIATMTFLLPNGTNIWIGSFTTNSTVHLQHHYLFGEPNTNFQAAYPALIAQDQVRIVAFSTNTYKLFTSVANISDSSSFSLTPWTSFNTTTDEGLVFVTNPSLKCRTLFYADSYQADTISTHKQEGRRVLSPQARQYMNTLHCGVVLSPTQIFAFNVSLVSTTGSYNATTFEDFKINLFPNFTLSSIFLGEQLTLVSGWFGTLPTLVFYNQYDSMYSIYTMPSNSFATQDFSKISVIEYTPGKVAVFVGSIYPSGLYLTYQQAGFMIPKETDPGALPTSNLSLVVTSPDYSTSDSIPLSSIFFTSSKVNNSYLWVTLVLIATILIFGAIIFALRSKHRFNNENTSATTVSEDDLGGSLKAGPDILLASDLKGHMGDKDDWKEKWGKNTITQSLHSPQKINRKNKFLD